MFERLAERERAFRPPEALLPSLNKVREFLREELAEGPAEEMTLARAGLTLAASWGGDVSIERMVPLAAGVEMIYHALTVQQASIHPDGGADLFGILSQDLVLARALDLYTTDGNPRVMDAVSRGAAHLCEALMAERVRETASALRHLGCFHVGCARVGWFAAGAAEGWEQEISGRLYDDFQDSFGRLKEKPAPAENGHESDTDLLGEFLRRWLKPGE